MLIKRSPSGPPESISSSLVQFSEESLYYSLTWQAVSTWSSSHSDSPIFRYFCLLERFCRYAFIVRVLNINKSPFVSFNTTKFTKTRWYMYP